MLTETVDISIGRLENGMDVSTLHGHIQINPRRIWMHPLGRGCILGYDHVPWMHPRRHGCILGYFHAPWMHPRIYPCTMDAS